MNKLHTGQEKLEQRLGKDIRQVRAKVQGFFQAETRKRDASSKNTGENIDSARERVSCLESPGTPASTRTGSSPPSSTSTWKPDHIISRGGWPQDMTNPERPQIATHLPQGPGEAPQGCHLRPWCPRRDGARIAKRRFDSTSSAASAQLLCRGTCSARRPRKHVYRAHGSRSSAHQLRLGTAVRGWFPGTHVKSRDIDLQYSDEEQDDPPRLPREHRQGTELGWPRVPRRKGAGSDAPSPERLSTGPESAPGIGPSFRKGEPEKRRRAHLSCPSSR